MVRPLDRRLQDCSVWSQGLTAARAPSPPGPCATSFSPSESGLQCPDPKPMRATGLLQSARKVTPTQKLDAQGSN